MKIGVSSYSYSQYFKSGKLDFHSVIKKAKDMGFSAIEFTDLPDTLTQEEKTEFAKQLKSEAAACGIDISAYAVGGNLYKEPDELKAETERLKKQIDVAYALGTPNFRYDVLYAMPNHTSFKKIVDTVAPAMRELAEYGKTKGIKTMIENHGLVMQDPDRIERLYEAIDHDNFGLLIDIGNFMCADLDNVACVARLASLACHVHLKDFEVAPFGTTPQKDGFFKTRSQNFLCGTSVGDGNAHARQCLEILKNSGYTGYVDIEYEGTADCIEGISRGRDFVLATEKEWA